MPEEKKENVIQKIWRSWTTNEKEDAGGTPFTVYHCVNAATQADCKARYTLFANNSEIGAKRRKNNVRRIVYKRRFPCFANRFFAIRRTQDLRQGCDLVDKHKELFRQKKSSAALKLTANNEQCTATHSSRFRQQYFIRWKNNFVPLFVMFAHVCE